MNDVETKPSKLTPKERTRMYRLWLKGWTYSEIAKRFGTYRQKPRSVVLSFKPSFADERRHHHYRLLRLWGGRGERL